MAQMAKTVSVRAKNISLNGDVIYLRLLALNSMKKLPLSRVMAYKNSAVPLSLFVED